MLCQAPIRVADRDGYFCQGYHKEQNQQDVTDEEWEKEQERERNRRREEERERKIDFKELADMIVEALQIQNLQAGRVETQGRLAIQVQR